MRVLYRADGGHPIGTGHLFRAARLLRALAERVDLEASLLFAEDTAALSLAQSVPARLTLLPPRRDPQAVKPLLEAQPVLEHLAKAACDLIVVDMLDTPASEMAALAATDIPLVTFDDRGEGRLWADTIVNILVTEPEPARLRASTTLLEGGAYVALDPAFGEAHDSPAPREFGPLRRIFVAMGGADAAGLTVKVARALCSVVGMERVEFLSGPAFPHRPALDTVLETAPWSYAIHQGLPDLRDRYRWCDLAVVAGGLIMYEVCCTGTPSLAVCQPIDHQLELSERLSAQGAMATVGYGHLATEAQIAEAVRELVSVERRRSMALQGPSVVDGRGAARVAEALIALVEGRGNGQGRGKRDDSAKRRDGQGRVGGV